MGNGIIVPKQEVVLELEPKQFGSTFTRSALVTANLLWFYQTYNLDHLGIELEPLVDRYWEYHPNWFLDETLFDEGRNFLGADPTPTHEDWIVLPERAKLIVKRSITLQRMFEALLLEDFEAHPVPDRNAEYYIFPHLFKNVLEESELEKEVINTLNKPSVSKNSTTVPLTVLGTRHDERLRFEFIVTTFAGWKFFRVAAVEYNGNRFEYCLSKPGETNVYKIDSPLVQPLKDCCVVFARSIQATAFEEFIYNFAGRTIRTLINEDMALHIRSQGSEAVKYHDETELQVKFRQFQPDYTMFLEQ
jgi:hypothetical protein